MASDDHQYLLANGQAGAVDRLKAMSELFDEWTLAHLDRLGLAPGWRCWEVGAGGPQLVEVLARRVGPTGRVLATDIDPVAVQEAQGGSIEVLTHDVAGAPSPSGDGVFDLVHARLVLVHLAQRDQAVSHMVRALRPGGWLVVEDADPALQPLSVLDPHTEAEHLANRLRADFRVLLARRGADLAYGRTLPRLLRSAGLEQVEAEAFFPMSRPACAPLELATMAVVGPQLVEAGLASEQDIAAHVAHVQSGTLDLVQPPLVTAWGQR